MFQFVPQIHFPFPPPRRYRVNRFRKHFTFIFYTALSQNTLCIIGYSGPPAVYNINSIKCYFTLLPFIGCPAPLYPPYRGRKILVSCCQNKSCSACPKIEMSNGRAAKMCKLKYKNRLDKEVQLPLSAFIFSGNSTCLHQISSLHFFTLFMFMP